MTEEEKQTIISDKLTNEGQLIRNTGKNSIKSINTRLDRFSDVFSSINNSLMLQSVILQESLNLTNEEMEMKRREALQAAEEAESRKRREELGGNDEPRPRSPIEEATGKNSLRSRLEEAYRSAFGFFSSGVASAAVRVASAGALLAVAPAIGSFIGDFVKAAITDMLDGDGMPLSEAQKEFVNNFGDALTTGATWGLFGLIFGKKFAAAMFAVTAIADYFKIDEAAENFLTSLGMDKTFAEATVKIALGVASGVLMLAVPFIVKRTLAGVSLALSTYAWPALRGAGAAIMAGASSLISTVSAGVASFIDDALKAMGSLSKYLKFAGGPLLGAIIGILTPTQAGDGELDPEMRGIMDDPTLDQDQKNAKISELLKEREKRYKAGEIREKMETSHINAFNTPDYPYASNYRRPETMVTGGLTTNGIVMPGSDQERMLDRTQNTILPIIEKMQNDKPTTVDLSEMSERVENEIRAAIEVVGKDDVMSELDMKAYEQDYESKLVAAIAEDTKVRAAQLNQANAESTKNGQNVVIVNAPTNVSPTTIYNGGSKVVTNNVSGSGSGMQSVDHGLPRAVN